MKLKHENPRKKLIGSYYTPKKAADFITKCLLNGTNPKFILEPSCGNGRFIESVINYYKSNSLKMHFKCIGIELVGNEVLKTHEKFKDLPNIKIHQADFFEFYETLLKEEKFDLILGNPPYIRYQYLTNEQRELLSQLLIQNGMRPNKLINAWVAFIVACVRLLADKGKIGMVLPAELLQVSYAEELRKFLVNKLKKITLYTFQTLIFPKVQQEVLFLLGEKDISDNNCQIRVIQSKNLDNIETNLKSKFLSDKLIDHNNDKWTKYFLNEEELFFYKIIKSNPNFISLKEVAVVEVGITTGANKYFSVNKEIVRKYDLDDVVIPLIGRSSHTKGLYFTLQDWQENVNANVDAFLIKFPETPFEDYPEKHKKYIKMGEEKDIQKGYKCSIRERWYIVPSVWVPDAFFLRRNNFIPKFVLNDINAVSTDTMHRVKFHEHNDPKKVLLSYYNSISIAFTEIEGRSHGGGVLELMPGEVENLLLPNLQDLSNEIVDTLINKIDQAMRKKSNLELVIDEIDQKILVEFLGLHPIIPKVFRIIWKKLIQRRHSRKNTQKTKKIVFSDFYDNPLNKKEINNLINKFNKQNEQNNKYFYQKTIDAYF